MLTNLMAALRQRISRASRAGERAAPAAPADASQAAAELPATLDVCRKPEDMPRFDAVISGTSKEAAVQLRLDDARHIAVLRQGQALTVLVSTEIYRTPQSFKAFAAIREQLAGQKYERERVQWATPEIVEGARNRKKGNGSGDTLATAKTRFALEFAEWLEYGLEERATDMHVERVGDVATLRYRIDGVLEPLRNGADGQIMGELAKDVIAHVYNKLIDEDSNTNSSFNAKAYFSSTVTYDLPKKRLLLRCQNNPTVDGFNFIARFRIDGEGAPTFTYQKMGYTASQIATFEEVLKGRRGLIVVAGIPNSAKTTLIQTMLAHFPEREKYKFVTLDDPVEFKLPGVAHATVKSVPGNPEESAKLYTQAMESWLRGNPDVISLGEIRNFASGFSAVTAARVGCLGLATLHANSQMGIYERLTDPEIGLSMHAITSDQIIALAVYQSLVPLLCRHCNQTAAQIPLPLRLQMEAAGERFGVDISGMRFAGGKLDGAPCPHCQGRGTHGQKVVAEMYSPSSSEEFLKLMRKGDDFGARAVWRATSDGRHDSDDMRGKPVFLHALKDALDGLIDPRACERFGSFETFDLGTASLPRVRRA